MALCCYLRDPLAAHYTHSRQFHYSDRLAFEDQSTDKAVGFRRKEDVTEGSPYLYIDSIGAPH